MKFKSEEDKKHAEDDGMALERNKIAEVVRFDKSGADLRVSDDLSDPNQ